MRLLIFYLQMASFGGIMFLGAWIWLGVERVDQRREPFL